MKNQELQKDTFAMSVMESNMHRFKGGQGLKKYFLNHCFRPYALVPRYFFVD